MASDVRLRLASLGALFTIMLGVAAPREPLAAPAPGHDVTSPSRVGMVTRDYSDPQRRSWSGDAPRPLRTAIWYPTDSPDAEINVLAPGSPLLVPAVIENGPLPEMPRRYPLVLLSHGTGGSAIQMMWLGHFLASRGYIVAAVNHHGNTGSEPRPAPQGFLLYWERPQDLTAVLDHLLADREFGSHIDPARIGAAGFSLGGYTVIAVGGGRFNPRVYEAFCASPARDFTCGPQPEFPDAPRLFEGLRATDPYVQSSLARAHASFKDMRIRSIFALAPALGSGFAEDDLKDVNVPVHIVVGNGDTVAPADTNARRLATMIRGATLTILPGLVGHYTFLDECTATGQHTIPVCRDAPEVNRAAVHAQVSVMASEFFQSTLVSGAHPARR